jgi:predicted RNA-binding protein YlxR (DUF448 family)
VALPFDDIGNTQKVRGAFQFDAGAIKDARAVVVQEARVMGSNYKQLSNQVKETASETQKSSSVIGTAINGIANKFRTAKEAAEQFAKTNLGVISNGLKGIADQWKYASLAASGFVVQGLRSADSINNLRVRFTGMLGTQAKAEKLMAEIGNRARELGQPMRAAQEAAAALLPQLQNNTEQLKVYMGLASRLSSLNQSEGLAGASFAIREAISSGGTDLVSLAERFNISKKQLREEIAAAKKSGLDETTAFATALDKILNKMGLTEDVAGDLANSFGNQVRVAFEEVNLAAGEMFGPLLKDVVAGVRAFSSFVSEVRQTHPELLKIAAASVLIVAAISPISFVLSKVITGFTLMKAGVTAVVGAVKSLASIGSVISRIVAGFGAMKAGVIATFSALKSYLASAIVGLKALPGIIAANSSMINANATSWRSAGMATKLGVGAAAVGTGVFLGGQVTTGLAKAGVQGGDFERIRKGEDALAIAGERFKQVIVIVAGVGIEFARNIVKFGALLINAFDQVLNAIKLGATYLQEGFLKITSAFGQVLIAVGQLLAQIPGQEGNALLLAGLETTRRTTHDLTNVYLERDRLQKRISEGFALPAETEASIDATFDQLGASVIGGLNNFFFPQADRAGAIVKRQFARLGDDLVEGAESMFSDDMISAWGDFQDELADIEADAQKEREEELDKHEKEKTKLEADQRNKRLEAIEDFNREQSERELDLRLDFIDLENDTSRKRKELREKFDDEELDRLKDHRLNILKLSAALDGRGLYLAQQEFKNETDQRKRAFKDERKALFDDQQRRIEELKLQFQRETDEKNRHFYGVELPRLQAQQAEELQEFENAHQERLTQITTQAAEQSAAAEQAFIDTFNKLVEQEGLHQDMMLGEQRKGQAAMEAELKAWYDRQKAMFASGNNVSKQSTGTGTSTSPFYGSNNPYAPNTPVTPVTPFPNLPTSPNDQGFFPDLAGAASLAMTAANSMSTQSAAASNTVSGGGRGGALAGLQIGTFAPQIVLGDIGKRSDKEVEELIDRGIMKTLKKVAKGGRS